MPTGCRGHLCEIEIEIETKLKTFGYGFVNDDDDNGDDDDDDERVSEAICHGGLSRSVGAVGGEHEHCPGHGRRKCWEMKKSLRLMAATKGCCVACLFGEIIFLYFYAFTHNRM